MKSLSHASTNTLCLLVFSWCSLLHAEEPNDSIPTATPTGISAGDSAAKILMGNNGDGDHASTGDIDIYALSANAGQIIRVDVQARSIGRVMDSVAGILSSDGTVIASNDDDGQSQDSFINFEAPEDDDYYVVVSSWVRGDAPANLPSDPFTAGNGPGAPGGGIDDYELVIALDIPVVITRSGGAFPVVTVNETSTATLTLLNEGKSELVVNSLSFEGENASMFAILNELPLDVVPSGESVAVEMTYASGGLNGRFPVTLIVESNDSITPTLEVPLNGAAYRPGGLIARFPLDEPTGTPISAFGAVEDLTGNEFQARFFQNADARVTFARPSLVGDGGTSVNFTGSPNAYIQVSNLVHLPTVSLSLWFRAEGDGGILNRDPMFSSNDTFYGLDISAGALRWRVGGETVIETEPGAIQNGMIYHAVITHLDEDGFGNDTAMQSRLFLNGVMIGEVTDPIGYDTYDNVEGTNNRRLWIGTKSGGNGYGGQIDDIQVYDVELTPTEAVELFTTPGSAARVENPNLATTSGGIFGTPPPNTGLQERALAITNTGESETLTIASAIVTGTSKDRFTIGDVPAELAPGATAFVPVTLDPAGQDGTFTAQIEFETNDEGGATVIVDLTTRVEKESGLLTHFKMDETQGTAMIDSSGNEFHGEYKTTDGGSFTLGAPGLADGTAVRLNDAGGSGAAFGELAKDAGLPSLSSLTISMWVKFDPSESGGIAVLFSKGEIVGNPFSVVLGVTDAANPFQWFAGEEEAITTSPVLEIDQVHHVVISHLDSNGPDEGADKTTIYVDNVIAGESTPSVGFDDNRSSLLQIGAFIGTIGLNGTVDDFQLYARAYEAEDVAFLFENPGQVIGVKTVPPAATVPILSDVSFSGDSFSLSVSGETPADIEYSENLENWEVIANSQTGAFADSDADRAGKSSGYYRAKLTP